MGGVDRATEERERKKKGSVKRHVSKGATQMVKTGDERLGGREGDVGLTVNADCCGD